MSPEPKKYPITSDEISQLVLSETPIESKVALAESIRTREPVPPSKTTPDDDSLFARMVRKSQGKKQLWISGPFTSINSEALENITKKADAIALDAWERGWIVISPHKNCSGFAPSMQLNYDEWMIALAAQIRMCDALLLLPDWEKSRGCILEKRFAEYYGIPVYKFERDGVPRP